MILQNLVLKDKPKQNNDHKKTKQKNKEMKKEKGEDQPCGLKPRQPPAPHQVATKTARERAATSPQKYVCAQHTARGLGGSLPVRRSDARLEIHRGPQSHDILLTIKFCKSIHRYSGRSGDKLQ